MRERRGAGPCSGQGPSALSTQAHSAGRALAPGSRACQGCGSKGVAARQPAACGGSTCWRQKAPLKGILEAPVAAATSGQGTHCSMRAIDSDTPCL